jgi:hypothetical protein
LRPPISLQDKETREDKNSSQADSAGSIPVTRSISEKRCSTSESGYISQTGQRSSGAKNGTRAITRALSHLGEFHWRLSVPKLTVRLLPVPEHLTFSSNGFPSRRSVSLGTKRPQAKTPVTSTRVPAGHPRRKGQKEHSKGSTRATRRSSTPPNPDRPNMSQA